MKIVSEKTGKIYEVRWRYHGYSYAIAIVYVEKEKRFLWFKCKKLTEIWEGTTRSSYDAEKMLPREMKKWFQESIAEYEKYTEAWENEKGKILTQVNENGIL